MTLDVYADLFDDDLDAVGARLDEAASEARADPVRTKRGPRSLIFLREQPDIPADLR